jgi:hypothetical protein
MVFLHASEKLGYTLNIPQGVPFRAASSLFDDNSGAVSAAISGGLDINLGLLPSCVGESDCKIPYKHFRSYRFQHSTMIWRRLLDSHLSNHRS